MPQEIYKIVTFVILNFFNEFDVFFILLDYLTLKNFSKACFCQKNFGT